MAVKWGEGREGDRKKTGLGWPEVFRLRGSHVFGLFFGNRLDTQFPETHLRLLTNLHILFFFLDFLVALKPLLLVHLNRFGALLDFFSKI